MESKNKIFMDYIGTGQIGIDFTKQDVFEAMDEYAKNFAVEFTRWYNNLPKEDAEHIVTEFLKSDYLKERMQP